MFHSILSVENHSHYLRRKTRHLLGIQIYSHSRAIICSLNDSSVGALTLQVSPLSIVLEVQGHRIKHYFIIHQIILAPPWNIGVECGKQNLIPMYFQISSDIEKRTFSIGSLNLYFLIFFIEFQLTFQQNLLQIHKPWWHPKLLLLRLSKI